MISAREVQEAQKLIEKVEVEEILLDYLMTLVEATRKSEFLTLGVSPRGAMALYQAAQARAFSQERYYCIPDDFKRTGRTCLFTPRDRQRQIFFSPPKP